MDREFNISFKLSDLLKLLVMSPVVVVLVLWALSWPWSDTNAPAWVQAVGSIAAIAVAIWVTAAQARTAKLDRQRREYHYMFKAFNQAGFAQACGEYVSEALRSSPRDTDKLNRYIRELQDAYKEVDAFTYKTMVDLDFANAWMGHKRCIRLLISYATEGQTSGHKWVVRGQEEIEKMKLSLSAYSMDVGSPVWDDHHP